MFFINHSSLLLGLIVVVFISQAAFPWITGEFWLNPTHPNWYMFITSIFLHFGLLHLFFNGYALLMFGSILERRIGKNDFLILFFLAGLAGGVAYYGVILLGIIPPIPALGASGAVYGILGALAIIMPELVVYLYFFPVPIRVAAVLWVMIESIGTFNPDSGIASAAHLGGLAFGIAFGFYYKGRMPKHKETFRW